jgi:hypothetical protein
MAISVKELRDWLAALADDDRVACYRGGVEWGLVKLPAVDDEYDLLLEIGGDPDYDDDDDGDPDYDDDDDDDDDNDDDDDQ